MALRNALRAEAPESFSRLIPHFTSCDRAMLAALACEPISQNSPRPFQAMGPPNQETCATSHTMDGRAQQAQLDSTQRRRINVDACFNAPKGAETLLKLEIVTAEINSLDVLRSVPHLWRQAGREMRAEYRATAHRTSSRSASGGFREVTLCEGNLPSIQAC